MSPPKTAPSGNAPRKRSATPPDRLVEPPPPSSAHRWLLGLTATLYLMWLSFLAMVALLLSPS